jgi:hypothetical protein
MWYSLGKNLVSHGGEKFLTVRGRGQVEKGIGDAYHG